MTNIEKVKKEKILCILINCHSDVKKMNFYLNFLIPSIIFRFRIFKTFNHLCEFKKKLRYNSKLIYTVAWMHKIDDPVMIYHNSLIKIAIEI